MLIVYHGATELVLVSYTFYITITLDRGRRLTPSSECLFLKCLTYLIVKLSQVQKLLSCGCVIFSHRISLDRRCLVPPKQHSDYFSF